MCSMPKFACRMTVKHSCLTPWAVGNLAGEKWAKRNEAKAAAAGQGSVWSRLSKALNLEGVGQGSNSAEQQIVTPVAFAGGHRGEFCTPVVAGSELPALWGFRSMASKKCLIDTHNRKLYMPGAGGYKLALSPGSVTLNLEVSESGHLMLPCSEWSTAGSGPAKIAL